MSASLLSTKFYVPPARPNGVSRARLIERLTKGLHGKLTLISAPAGSGKTTLVSEWVASCGQPVAWVSLDEGDNDLVRFWSYFVAACQSLRPGVGESALELLQSHQPLADDAVPTILINDLAGLDSDLVLVLTITMQSRTGQSNGLSPFCSITSLTGSISCCQRASILRGLSLTFELVTN